jgi:hypothetical protein
MPRRRQLMALRRCLCIMSLLENCVRRGRVYLDLTKSLLKLFQTIIFSQASFENM